MSGTDSLPSTSAAKKLISVYVLEDAWGRLGKTDAERITIGTFFKSHSFHLGFAQQGLFAGTSTATGKRGIYCSLQCSELVASRLFEALEWQGERARQPEPRMEDVEDVEDLGYLKNVDDVKTLFKRLKSSNRSAKHGRQMAAAQELLDRMRRWLSPLQLGEGCAVAVGAVEAGAMCAGVAAAVAGSAAGTGRAGETEQGSSWAAVAAAGNGVCVAGAAAQATEATGAQTVLAAAAVAGSAEALRGCVFGEMASGAGSGAGAAPASTDGFSSGSSGQDSVVCVHASCSAPLPVQVLQKATACASAAEQSTSVSDRTDASAGPGQPGSSASTGRTAPSGCGPTLVSAPTSCPSTEGPAPGLCVDISSASAGGCGTSGGGGPAAEPLLGRDGGSEPLLGGGLASASTGGGPAPALVVCCCIDLEWWEMDNTKVTEVGWTLWDNLTRTLVSRHHIVSEHLALANRLYVPDHKYAFRFGTSAIGPLAAAAAALQDDMAGYGRRVWLEWRQSQRQPQDAEAAAEADVDAAAPPVQLVIVGHGLSGDLRALSSLLGVELPPGAAVVDTVDLAWAALGPAGNGGGGEGGAAQERLAVSLRLLLKMLGISATKLHNGGNDARYTMEAALALCGWLQAGQGGEQAGNGVMQ